MTLVEKHDCFVDFKCIKNELSNLKVKIKNMQVEDEQDKLFSLFYRNEK
ncbi:MAG: hypothetical protein ACTSVI_14465 [Promethearchaeota archaeon]